MLYISILVYNKVGGYIKTHIQLNYRLVYLYKRNNLDIGTKVPTYFALIGFFLVLTYNV